MEIPIDQIRPSPYQPRLSFDLEDIRGGVAKALKEGHLPNLVVRKVKDYYELIDGERRWRIAKQEEFKTVPCQIVDVDDETARRMIWRVNTARKEYTPKEKAHHFKKLQSMELSLRSIARECDQERHSVLAHLNALRLSEYYQNLVWNSSLLSVGHIQELESYFDEEKSGLINPPSPIIDWLNQTIDHKWTVLELREALKPEREKAEKRRIALAKEVVAPEVKLESPEDFERAAEALRKEAERRKTPEQKTEEKRQKLIAQARKSLNTAKKKIDSASKITDISGFRERFIELEKSLEQNPDEVRKQLIALGKEVTEAKKQRQKEIKEEKRHKEQVEKTRKLLSSISFEECEKLGIDIKPYKNEIAEIESYLDEKPAEAWNTADALKKRLEKEVNEVKIQKEAEKRAKELEEAEKRRIAEEAEAKTREELLKDKEFIRGFIKKEYSLMHEALGTEDLEELLMERLMASIPKKKKDRAKEIFREEFRSLRKRLKMFPKKSAKMEPKFEYLRLMEERGVIPYTIWDFQYRDDYAGDKDFHGNCSPQTVEQCIWRFSNEDQLLLDPMAGSGTALDVCKKYNRRYIGYDIKPPEDRPDIIQNDSRKIPLEEESVDIIFIHPPYWNLTYYTKAEKNLPDLSRAKTVEEYLAMLKEVFKECYRVLKHGKFMCVLLGDLIREGRFIPLCRKATNIAEEIGFIDYGYTVKLAHGEVSRKKSGVIIAEPFYTRNLKISHDLVIFLRKPEKYGN